VATFIEEKGAMASYQVLYWQEIPSQVDARESGKAHKEMLSQRFQELIDIVATKRNIVQSDAYINGWSKGEKSERPGSAIDVAKSVASEFEAQYDSIRAAALANTGTE
jgi:Virulence factor